jgi:hypothetical protein
MEEIKWKPIKVEDRDKTVLLTEPIMGYTKIMFIGHAQDRMEDWGLTENDALKTLKSPDATGLPTDPGRERVRRNKTALTAIDVVYEKKPDLLRVITVIKVKRRLIQRKRKQ